MKIGGTELVLTTVIAVSLLSASGYAGGARKKHKPAKKSVAEIVFDRYPALRGTPEDGPLTKQNEKADEYDLPRIESDEELESLKKSGYLARVPDKSPYFYLDGMPDNLRWLSPDALDYLAGLSENFSKKFSSIMKRRRLKITSLTRTLAYQKWLAKRNANAARGEAPEKRSVHLTGYSFDISTRELNGGRILWLAGVLNGDEDGGLSITIFEPHKNNFHVFVVPK